MKTKPIILLVVYSAFCLACLLFLQGRAFTFGLLGLIAVFVPLFVLALMPRRPKSGGVSSGTAPASSRESISARTAERQQRLTAEELELYRKLKRVEDLLNRFGHARDAADRGLPEAGRHLEEETTAQIRTLLEGAPELQPLLPRLWAEASSRNNIAECREIYPELRAAIADLEQSRS